MTESWKPKKQNLIRIPLFVGFLSSAFLALASHPNPTRTDQTQNTNCSGFSQERSPCPYWNNPTTCLRLERADLRSADRWWNNFLDIALDEDDLDARDSHNRPVRSEQARARLKDLFVMTLFTSLVDENLGVLSQARRFLEKLFTPLSEEISRAGRGLLREIEIALLPNFQNLTDLIKLCMCFIAMAFAFALLSYRFLGYLPLSAYHSPLNSPLRC